MDQKEIDKLIAENKKLKEKNEELKTKKGSLQTQLYVTRKQRDELKKSVESTKTDTPTVITTMRKSMKFITQK